MMRTSEDYDRLLAELNADISDLSEALSTNERAIQRIHQGSEDELDLAALGYTIHNVYGIVEGYCFRVAKFFENGLDDESWHRDLLRRMTLEIPGVRPALLMRETWVALDELRSFRHLFRHLYARPLQRDRLLAVQARVPAVMEQFRTDHNRFSTELDRIRTALEEGS